MALHVVGEGGGGGVASIADATLVRLPVVMCLQVDFQMIAPAKVVIKVVGEEEGEKDTKNYGLWCHTGEITIKERW